MISKFAPIYWSVTVMVTAMALTLFIASRGKRFVETVGSLHRTIAGG
jgi:hypothetical protein